MKNPIKTVVIALIALAALLFMYKLLFLRTVNYEIGGIKIPSTYNILTGTVKPLKDYKGKEIHRSVGDRQTQPKNVGLSSDEYVSAQVRWAVFVVWVKSRSKYKGWDTDTEIFKRAQDDFLKEMEASGRKVTIIR